jgi:hypothetical protein
VSFRGFGGITTIPASAVPVYGTTLNSAAVINPDLHTGQIDTRGNRSQAVLSVANSVPFRVGDKVAIGTAVMFEQGNTVAADGGAVVAVGNGTITVQGLQRSHASGEFVVLAMTCASIGIQVLGASSSFLYLAEDGTAGPASPTMLNELSAGGFFQFGVSPTANCFDTQKLWIQGGAGSQYIPSFITV